MINCPQSIELNWQLAAMKQYCAIGITFNMNLLRDFLLLEFQVANAPEILGPAGSF